MTNARAEDISIRLAGIADIARLSLIANATFLETFAGEIAGDALIAHCNEKHAPAYLAQLLDTGAKAWLAELDQSPVGYALLTAPDLKAARDGDVELRKIYLLSRFHGLGIAQRLLEAAVDGAAGNGRLILGVKADNVRAIAFYEKHHFKQVDTRRFDVGGTLYDDIVLARALGGNTDHE